MVIKWEQCQVKNTWNAFIWVSCLQWSHVWIMQAANLISLLVSLSLCVTLIIKKSNVKFHIWEYNWHITMYFSLQFHLCISVCVWDCVCAWNRRRQDNLQNGFNHIDFILLWSITLFKSKTIKINHHFEKELKIITLSIWMDCEFSMKTIVKSYWSIQRENTILAYLSMHFGLPFTITLII